jgi:hypothetical protein
MKNDTQAGKSFDSPGTGKGSSDSASPLSQSRGAADPSNVNDRGDGGKEDLLRPFDTGSAS